MTQRKRVYEKPLYIEMEFGEALERFGQSDPAEIPDSKKLKRGATKKPAKKAGGRPPASKRRPPSGSTR